MDRSGVRHRFGALVLCGIGSVLWWRATGDLRAYAVAQFGPMLVLVPAFVSDKRIRALWPVIAWYAVAKFAEGLDRQIYAVFPLSGHTLKHLAGAVATYWILRWRVTAPPISASTL